MSPFLVDENLPVRLAMELSSRGLQALHVSNLPALRASPDREIVEYAEREGLVLLTKDKELSFAARFPEASRHGVVCVRITERLTIEEQVRIILAALLSLDPREFASSVIVVEPGRVRVRRRIA